MSVLTQGAFFGGLMGSITKVDPAQLQQSATTPGMNSGRFLVQGLLAF